MLSEKGRKDQGNIEKRNLDSGMLGGEMDCMPISLQESSLKKKRVNSLSFRDVRIIYPDLQ
jgi:hypothetical protein